MEQILTYKKGKGALSTDEVIEQFLMFDDIKQIKNVVENSKDRIFAAWSTVDSRDKDGERIPIEDFARDMDTLIERGAPIQDSHTNAHVGRTLAYKIMRHPKTKTLGVLQLNQIFDDNHIDNKVWEGIKNGEYKGLSVGGSIENGQGLGFEKDPETGQMTRVLSGFRQYETSAVNNPANPWALNEAVSLVAKSVKPVKISHVLFKELKKKYPEITREEFEKIVNAAYTSEELEELSEATKEETTVQKPFAGFQNFAECVAQNKDKEDAQAFCGALQARAEKGELGESFIYEELYKEFKEKKEKEIKGDKMADEISKKEFTDLKDSVETLAKTVESLVKKPSEKEEEVEGKSGSVAAKDGEEGDGDAPEAKKEVKERKPIAGDGSGKAPKNATQSDDSNDVDAYKEENEKLKEALKAQDERLKALEAGVKKSVTPKTSYEEKIRKQQEVADAQADLALKIAKGEFNKGSGPKVQTPGWRWAEDKMKQFRQGIVPELR